MDEETLTRMFDEALPDAYLCLSPMLRRFLGGLCSQTGDDHGPRTTSCVACNDSICTSHRFRVRNDCPLCPDAFVCAKHRLTYQLETFACSIVGCRIRRTWCSKHQALGPCARQAHVCLLHSNSWAAECTECKTVHHNVHTYWCACTTVAWATSLCPRAEFNQPVECPPHWTHSQPPGRVLTSRVIWS